MTSTAKNPGSDNEPRHPPPQASDHAAFEQFYHEHYLSVVRYLASQSGSARFVEDAAQEAMATMWTKWAMIVDTTSNRKAYLFVIARRALSRMRKHPDSRFLPLDPACHDIVDRRNLAIDWIESNLDLAAALKALPSKQREAAILAWVCDFSVKEIARMLGTRPGTVKTHLWRARRKLRRHKTLLARLRERGEEVL